jgi:serine/threonine-protein kinase
VLERDPEKRAAFLETACADDDELREAVEDLLTAEVESVGFLERPLDALTTVPWNDVLAELTRITGSTDEPAGSVNRSGDRVGAYRLVRQLGRGGMATVYLAERADGLWEQRVALKLIRRGLDTQDVIRRFLSERQILSSLDHPNIARLLDGGTTEKDLPYLVMECVEGTPITTYCDERQLPIEDRLRLFCDAGRAVQHAHRSLVVHRDLKPSNILVTDEGRVKLLDFGIAKILDPAEESPRTRTGHRPLTPEYASPEQLGGDSITTASDVYQLGLLLCKLLSGHRPYETPRMLSPARRQAHLERAEPSLPSSLVDAEAARDRSASEERLVRRLRGDLDRIVLKAIPGDPEQRYPSTEALVGDVERHLAGLPITARPPTLAYRTRKLLRRRPWLLPAAAAALLVLAGYVFTLVRHSNQLERERNLARTEAERAEEVQQLLVDVFRSADPYAPGDEVDPDITVRDALALGARRVRGELEGQPGLQATLLGAIGDVYANLDLVERARALREEALGLDREVHGPESARVARDMRKLGALMILEGRPDSAEALLTRSLELLRSTVGPRDTAVAGVLVDLGDLAHWRGRHAEAVEHLESAVDLLMQQEPLPAAHLAAAYTELLDVYPMSQRMEEARHAAEEAARLSRTAYGEDHPRTAIVLVQLADLYDWDGRGEDAARVYQNAIAILDRTLGREHEQTLQARNNLAVTLRHMGELEAAERVHREILAAWRAKGEGRERRVADALQNLAVVLQERGELAEAESRLVEARDLYDKVLGRDHYTRAYPRLTLASVRAVRGQFLGAERAAREAIEILEATMPESSYVTATARCRLGRALSGQGRHGEARTMLERGVETLSRTARPSVRYEIECRRALADLYRTTGRRDLARPQMAKLRRLEASVDGAS